MNDGCNYGDRVENSIRRRFILHKLSIMICRRDMPTTRHVALIMKCI